MNRKRFVLLGVLGAFSLLFWGSLSAWEERVESEIVDFETRMIPLWDDTTEIVGTAIDTSGICVVGRGGVFSVILWTDGVGTGGDSVDVKLEYGIRFLPKRKTGTDTDANSSLYPPLTGADLTDIGSTYKSVLYDDSEWQSVFSSVDGDDEYNIASITPPLCEYIWFKVTGNTDNDSTKVLGWLLMEP